MSVVTLGAGYESVRPPHVGLSVVLFVVVDGQHVHKHGGTLLYSQLVVQLVLLVANAV